MNEWTRELEIDQLQQLHEAVSQIPGGATRARKLEASLRRMGVNIPQSNTQSSKKRQRWAQERQTNGTQTDQ